MTARDFDGPPRPYSIMFFPNGTAAVCDQFDRQMGAFQVGNHADTLIALERAGYPLASIPDVLGRPRPDPPKLKWDDPCSQK